MSHDDGLHGSLEETVICVVDSTGRIVKETRAPSEPEALIAALREIGLPLERVGLETCSLTAWLHDEPHGLRETQRRGKGHTDRPLWPWSRMTAWRHVTTVMAAADIPAGPHRSPKGLRHGTACMRSRAACRSTCEQVDGSRHARGDGDRRNALGAKSRASPRECGVSRPLSVNLSPSYVRDPASDRGPLAMAERSQQDG